MSKTMIACTIVVVVALHGVADTAGDASDEVVASARKEIRYDLLGDPLPARAVARIGSTRWWYGPWHQESPPCISPDGKTLVCCDGQSVRFLDLVTGRERSRIASEAKPICCKALSPDGKTLVTSGFNNDPFLRVWDVGTGKKLHQIAQEGYGMAFAKDGKTFAFGGNDIVLWDTATWREKRRFAGDSGLGSLVFLPDGKTLISGGGNSQAIRWWNVDTGREIRHLDFELEYKRSLCLSPNGKWLAAVVKSSQLCLWNASTGEEVHRIQHPRGLGFSLNFTRDSTILACSTSWAGHTILFEVETGREITRWNHVPQVYDVAFFPDGKTLAEIGIRCVYLRDVKTGRIVENPSHIPNGILAVRFLPDGKTLTAACYLGAVASWDAFTGRQQAPFRGPPSDFAGPAEWVMAPCLSPDASKAALIDKQGTLHVWETATGKAICRIDNPLVGPDEADFSPDGKVLVVKHNDYMIRVWDAVFGKLLLTLPLAKGISGQRFPHAHVFSEDGRLLATAPMSDQDRTLRVWETATGKELCRFSWPDKTEVTCLAFSPDGKYVLAAHGGVPEPGEVMKETEISVRLWELATGKERQRFAASAMDIRALAFSPDGKTVAVAEKSTVSLWEVASGKGRGQFKGHRDRIWSLTFSPRLLASGSWDHTALVWDITGFCPDGQWHSRSLRKDDYERLWDELASPDGLRAFAAVWALALAGDHGLPFLAARLKPAHAVESKRLEALIAKLDCKSYSVRQSATRELEELSELAEEALNRALAKQPTAEVQQRLAYLLGKLRGPVVTGEALRAIRGVEVLEHVGTSNARQILKALAEGLPGVRLTEQARLSLDRVNRLHAAQKSQKPQESIPSRNSP